MYLRGVIWGRCEHCKACAQQNKTAVACHARCDWTAWDRRRVRGVLSCSAGVGGGVERVRVHIDDTEHECPWRRVGVEGKQHLLHEMAHCGFGSDDADDLDRVAPRPVVAEPESARAQRYRGRRGGAGAGGSCTNLPWTLRGGTPHSCYVTMILLPNPRARSHMHSCAHVPGTQRLNFFG